MCKFCTSCYKSTEKYGNGGSLKRIISENFSLLTAKEYEIPTNKPDKISYMNFYTYFRPQRNKIMETSKTYNRTINLLDKYTKFIKSIDTEDIGNNLTLDKLIELKSILSDINNIMTLISTRSIATKLSDILSFKNEDRERIFNDIDKQKPNTMDST